MKKEFTKNMIKTGKFVEIDCAIEIVDSTFDCSSF